MQNSTITKPTIRVEKKEHYGNTLYYPVEVNQKIALGILTRGQKTLTETQCKALMQLGFRIDVIQFNPFTK
jgi:hypothetical protein